MQDNKNQVQPATPEQVAERRQQKIDQRKNEAKEINTKLIEGGFKVIHLRAVDEASGQVQGKGGATIVYRIDPVTNLVQVGASMCSKRDCYNKRLGIKSALQRFEQGQIGYGQFSISEQLSSYIGAIAARVTDSFMGGLVNKNETETLKNFEKTVGDMLSAAAAQPSKLDSRVVDGHVRMFFQREVAPALAPLKAR